VILLHHYFLKNIFFQPLYSKSSEPELYPILVFIIPPPITGALTTSLAVLGTPVTSYPLNFDLSANFVLAAPVAAI
jgi:hypothetical protein